MNVNRISFIDSLKGITILWVVMGHIAEKSIGLTDTPFNAFYASFHMPLFMFLSGLFAFKAFHNYNAMEYLAFFKKKALRIMVPFIVIGWGGYSLLVDALGMEEWQSAISGYWFLPALFYCMVTGSLTHLVRHHLAKGRIPVEVGIELVVWAALTAGYYAHVASGIPFYLHFIKMYPFFALGTFFFSHEGFREKLTGNRTWFAVAVIAYIASFMLPRMPMNLHAFFAIVILMQIFANYDAWIPRILSVVGTYSMEIYVFHWFLLPQLSECRTFFMNQAGSTLNNGNFVLLLVTTGAIAICITAVCIVVAKAIRCSRLLQILCFGG